MMAGADEEFANFSRLVKLIVNVGSDVLRDVLVHVIRPQTLENAFQTNLTTINRLHYGKPKVLFDDEFTLLSKTSPNPKDFDITLLVKIFRNICTTICPTVVSPNHDWNNTPGQTDISLADDIHRMRDIRNSMFAHIPNTNVTYNDFQSKWSEVRKVILRISGHGSPALKQQEIKECIDNLKTESIDQTTFQVLLQTLREQEKNHKETVEELKNLDATQKEIRDAVRETKNTVGEIRDTQVEMIKKIDTLVRDFKEKTDSKSKAEPDVGVPDKDDNQFEDQELAMNVEVGDDEELPRRLVRLIKWYPWLKSEMGLTETCKIAKVLLDKDSVGEILLEARRRIAVDRLLKHVLRTETTMRFFDLLKKYWKPSDELQEKPEQLEPSEEDIKAYRLAKIHDVPQWKFQDDDRKVLWFTIKESTTVDTLNNWFLSKFFYRGREHDKVFDHLLLPHTLGDGVDCLFDTMNKCDKSIMRCFCDTVETYCCGICKVVGRLDLRRTYCESATNDKGDSTVLRFLTLPLKGLFHYWEQLCFTVDRVEDGSLVVYLSANTDSSWEKLKQKCKSGEILEPLDTLDTDDQIRKLCFEEGACVRITIHSVKGKSAWPKAILRIDSISQDQSVGDGTETHPIKHNMDILCEELEICDSLIEELKEQNLVRDDIRELLEVQHTRASKIRCLMENISPPEKGFKVLQDYIKRCNTYLFEQLEISSEEYRNTEVFFTCEAQLAPYTAGSDLTRFKWVAKGMRFYDAEQEQCGDEHGKLSYTVSPEVMKLAKDSRLDETVSTVPKKVKGRQGKPGQYQIKPESYGINPTLPNVLESSPTTFSDMLAHGMEENYQIRVMVVGNGGVGKTTLTRRLLYFPVNLRRYDSTNGIDVHIHSCEIDLDTGEWGDRDYHLRCAKALQKYQELEKNDFTHCASGDDVPPGNANTEKPLSGCTDGNNLEAHQDKSQETETKEKESGTFQAYNQSRCTATADSHHRLGTKQDVTEALTKDKTLTAKQSNRKATVSFYDFAGQYVFHASHPTFLSSSAIYILTFDLHRILQKSNCSDVSVVERDKLYGDCRGAVEVSDLESMIFWLNIIYMFAVVKSETHPHVILVGTHVDKIPKEIRETIAANFFKEFRSAIAETPFNAILSETEFIVNNSKKNDKSYSRLKTEIFELAKLQSSWGEKTPAKWLPLDREIQQRKASGFKVKQVAKCIGCVCVSPALTPISLGIFAVHMKVLTLEELKTINRGLDINISNDAEMGSFLSFLHQSGKAIYYSDKFLRDNIVLDPVWLIGGLKTVITADKFAIRSPKLATQWKEFCESGVICRSAIVRIFEKNKEDPSLFKNHEHVIRLMEKFLFIAAPVDVHGDLDGNGEEAEKDVHYIIPCMVRKEADKNLLTNLEGSSRTTIFCMVAENHFLPPAIFQKLLAMCITKWPIVEQNGRKLIFCGVCKFNLDEANHYKLTLFLVNYAVHARIESFVDKEQPHQAVCQPVQEFLVHSLRSIFQAMELSAKFCQCIQCPQYSPTDSGGYLHISNIINQAAVTCDKCQMSHLLNVQELLGGWIDMKEDEIETTGIAVGGCAGQEKMPVSDIEEMDAEVPMTQQHINHARLCNVLVTVCADGLRDILLSHVPIGFADFYAALLTYEPTFRAMRHIRQEQLDLLFPDPNGQFTGTLDQFDITLLYALIRNISSVPAPVTGWGRRPEDQPRDTSLGANVERIRNCRNRVNAYSADGRLEDRVFEDFWDEISAIVDDIESSIGPKGYRIALAKRKNQVFTPKDTQKLQLKLKEFEEAINNLENVEDTIKKLKAIMEKYSY